MTRHLLLPFLLFTGAVFAQDSTGPGVGQSSVPATSVTSTGSMVVNVVSMLALVLLAIVCLAWVARKFLAGHLKNGRHIQVLETFPLGRSEKLCLVRVGGKTLLLGVTAQGVRNLQCWDEWPSDQDADSQGSSVVSPGSEFQKILSQLGKSS